MKQIERAEFDTLSKAEDFLMHHEHGAVVKFKVAYINGEFGKFGELNLVDKS